MPLDAFLKFEGEPIDGESQQKGHDKELELESFSFGASNGGTMHTATGGGKPATLSTGLVINVPFFVKIGDRVKVDTRTNSYVERA